MVGYWNRHRLFLSIIMCIVVALITSMLFVYPYIENQANNYNNQSIYKNSSIDFIAPEPSFEQVDSLPGTNGIDKIFPYFYTKTQISINGKTRTTNLLLSDQFQNIDITMYNQDRLIEKSDTEYSNPILVDWQFCYDTSAQIGDTVVITIGGASSEYVIYAIYETNTIYEGGAILAQISNEQKQIIAEQSRNNGYSGMYISANDYNTCQNYLTNDYRPLGRLKNREQFENDEQYQVHYDAIMSSGYANEITDFRVRENGFTHNISPLMLIIGAFLAFIIIIGFNVIMAQRGCEKVYFSKNCIPKGQNIKPYYNRSFVFEIISNIILFLVAIIVRIKMSDIYISRSAFNYMLLIVPVSILIAEIISYAINCSMVNGMIRKIKEKLNHEQ